MMFHGSFFTMTDLPEVGKVMISKVILLAKPRNSVSTDLRLTLIQFLCLNILNAHKFSLRKNIIISRL